MSIIFAMALEIVQPNHPYKRQIYNLLSIPDFVKDDIDQRLEAYIEAIRLDGYDIKKIRKMIALGNKGIIFYVNLKLLQHLLTQNICQPKL